MRLIPPALLAAALLATPAQAEVAAKGDTGFVIHLEADAFQPPDAVWPVLIAPAKWWSSDHTWSHDATNLALDARAGGCFCEQLPKLKDAPEGQRGGSVEHMRVIFVRPGAVLRLSGALGPLQGEALSGTMTIRLVPTKQGTHLTLDYVVGGYARLKLDDVAPMADQMLSEQLARLIEAAKMPMAEAK